jgi:serine/threonine-protein kinase
MAQMQRYEGAHRPARSSQPDTARVDGLDGRYVVYGEIASGGMASVQYGRLLGPHGFTRPVAIKRLHPHFAKEAEFLSMFIDEARLSARLVHANIIHTLDVIQTPGELALVMEYVPGESLWMLLRLAREQGRAVPIAVASSLIASTLHGLHAAHEARGEAGEPLEIVHRDVSPPNILVGSDGIPRLLDFGIAKALGRIHSTPSGEIKGKLGYVAPEQLHATHVDRRTDVYGASAVLWEALTGSPLFDGPSEPAIVHRVLYDKIEAPSVHRKDVPAALDAIVSRGLARDMTERFATAHEMALAIERSTRLASQSEIVTWLQDLAGAQLAARSRHLSALQVSRSEPKNAARSQPQVTTRRMPNASAAPADARTSATASEDPLLAVIRPRRSRSWAIAGVVAVLVVAASWVATAAPRTRAWLAHEVLEVSGSKVAVTDATVSVATSPEHAAPVVAEPEVDPSPPPTAAAATAEAPKRMTRRAATVQPQPSATPAVSARPADPCIPFYNVDERGIRHPKPECF